MISQSYLTSKSASKTHKSSIMAGVMQIGLDMVAEEALEKLQKQISDKQRKKEIVEADVSILPTLHQINWSKLLIFAVPGSRSKLEEFCD